MAMVTMVNTDGGLALVAPRDFADDGRHTAATGVCGG